MKTTGVYKFWQIIYPIGIYYVVSGVVFFALQMLLGNSSETYMLRQMLCAVATIPFIRSFYVQDKRVEDIVYGRAVRDILAAALSAAALGIAVNNVIAMTPLIEMSEGFTEANEQFFGGQLIYELLGSCFLIPVAEELLYRGVVYKRLRLFAGVGPALVSSALLFGVVHGNLVQFLYAGTLGLLLAFLLEKTDALYAPVAGHMAANLAAVVRQETGWLAFSYEPTAGGIGFTLLMFAIAAAVLAWLCRAYRDKAGEP